MLLCDHFNIEGQTALAEKFVRKTTLPFLFSALAELECRRAFILRAGHSNSENWVRLASKLDSREWIRFPMEWDRATDKCVELMDKFGADLKAGTLDTLHDGGIRKITISTGLDGDSAPQV